MAHSSLSWVLLLLLSNNVRIVQSLSQPVKVRVCQNKYCKKRYANLKQCVSQLLPEAKVESSGCLSQCNDGPNIEVESGGHATILNGIQDVTTAAILLEQNTEMSVPKILLAASKILEQVPSLDSAEGLRYLNSVISKLEASEYKASPAMARALVVRADLHLQSGEPGKALEDAQRVLELKQVATSETLALAYRILADTEENKVRVIAVLQQWQKDLPEFRTKLQHEIQRIVDSMDHDGDDGSKGRNSFMPV
ncbi:unnamed protein product [Cylindrotheca closterium]|uniref:Uncharacterized protein n=1 Tax=Cylindrotheca closterium TaxID=2856 RepID=A0AAD2CF56_9STRA|nr:unnamed protein product [Cylindrotheca closterium]